MTDIYLTRDERLMLLQLSYHPIAVWALSGMLKQEWMVAFNALHKAGLVTPISGANGPVAYGISDNGRKALLSSHGLSFFDLCYRSDEDDEYTW